MKTVNLSKYLTEYVKVLDSEETAEKVIKGCKLASYKDLTFKLDGVVFATDVFWKRIFSFMYDTHGIESVKGIKFTGCDDAVYKIYRDFFVSMKEEESKKEETNE